MKKYIFSSLVFFSLLIFGGCGEKDFDSIVDQESSSFSVHSVYSFSTFNYIFGDSLLPLRVNFSNDNGVVSVSGDVYDSDGNKLNDSPVTLLDNGNGANGDAAANDNVYSGVFPLSQTNPIGKYRVDYFVTDNQQTIQVAELSFMYDNGQSNIAPSIANLSVPDSVQLNTVEKTLIFITLDVFDENGLSDIDRAFFNSFIPPSGTPSVNNPFLLFDNGENGDQVAGDGTYSVVVELPPTGVTLGTYRWEFEARDKRNAASNKIIHNITVY